MGQEQDVPERFMTEITPLVYDLQFPADAPDVGFWVDWCREVGGPVLELGCGSGRVTLPVARAGLEVTGVEVAGPMLAVARERLSQEPAEVQARVRLVQGDMRDGGWGTNFGCAIIPANTFAVMITADDQARMLAAVRGALRPKGWFAFDLPVFPTEWLQERHEMPLVTRSSADGQVEFVESRTFHCDPSTGLWTSVLTYIFVKPDLGVHSEVVRGRPPSRKEIVAALAHDGFTVQSVWGGYGRTPFTKDSRKMIFAARRA